ncbi:ankyrin repeat-containing domain protein [Fusarium avenaceum]|nr:ankyrin repeat-containing domain protein [Fusarium avenaceum]
MPPSRIDWSEITDINQRRKLQNRQAQKNYRTRQKLRMQLAEAVLHDMPSLDVIFSGIKSRGKNHFTGTDAQVRDGDNTVHSSASARAPITGPGRHPSAATHLDQLVFANGARHLLEGDESELEGEEHERQESSERGVFLEAGTGTLTPNENEMAAAHHFDTLDLDHNNWIGIDYDPSSNALLSMGTHTAMTNNALDDNAVIGTCPSSRNIMPSSTRLTRSQASRITSPQGKNNRNEEADDPLEPCGGAPSPISLLGYEGPTRSSFTSPSTLKENTRLSASQKNITKPTTRGSRSGSSESSHKNPLLTAVMLGNLEVARLLLGSSAKLDDPDHNGKTNLHHAVQRGEVSMASALLELGADVTTTSSDGNSLFHTAVQNNDLEMVRMLLEWCNSYSRPKEQLSVTTSERVEERYENGKGTLIQRCINAQDGGRRTAVHLAVLLNQVEIVRVLLEYGADVNIGCE